MTPGTSMDQVSQSNSSEVVYMLLPSSWEDVICSICLEVPHSGALLMCSSHEKGCRPYICDTDQAHSNCLARFKIANDVLFSSEFTTPFDETPRETVQFFPSDENCHAICPLCRGHVSGFLVDKEARAYMDAKTRCCEEKSCTYIGNYTDLQNHGRLEHPNSRPAEIDPARQLVWDNLQQSSEITYVFSTTIAGTPGAVTLGGYVAEQSDESSGDGYEDLAGHEGNGWTSFIMRQVSDNDRASSVRVRVWSRSGTVVRSRLTGTRRPRSSYENLNSDRGALSFSTGLNGNDNINMTTNNISIDVTMGQNSRRRSLRQRLVDDQSSR